jgi:hypothetical protein
MNEDCKTLFKILPFYSFSLTTFAVQLIIYIMTFKQKVYGQFLALVNNKIAELQKTLSDLRESAANETKSTAGDKHETALAMLQIEQENTNRQISDVLLQKDFLEKIDPAVKSMRVASGSLVKTNKGYFFLSVGLGKLQVEGTTVIALSLESPLGGKLRGLKVNDTAEINGNSYVIESIE